MGTRVQSAQSSHHPTPRPTTPAWRPSSPASRSQPRPPHPTPISTPPTLQPFSGVYYTWQHAAVPGSKVQVPTWVLAFGGVGIVIGLATYGWHIMGLYGAKSVMISNCRGFSIELATALTVIFAARWGEPRRRVAAWWAATSPPSYRCKRARGISEGGVLGCRKALLSMAARTPQRGKAPGCSPALPCHCAALQYIAPRLHAARCSVCVTPHS